MSRSSLIIPENKEAPSKKENILSIDNILVDSGVLTPEQIKMAKAHLKFTNKSISDVIVDLDMAEETDILRAIKKVTSFSGDVVYFINDLELDSVQSFKYLFSYDVSSEKNQVIYSVDENNKTIKIATSDIINIKNLNSTKNYFNKIGYAVNFTATTAMSLSIIQSKVYKLLKNYDDIFYNLISDKINIGVNLSSIVKTVIENATIENASDIFFMLNKNQDFSYIFFKINREKEFKFVLPTQEAEKIHQYIKQDAKMEASKISGHQDGSLKIDILNKFTISVRTNAITTISGEQLTLRILKDGKNKLKELGFKQEDVSFIEKILKKQKGVVVVAGVTGSGKTTTLHAMLNYFDRDKYNIITLEDPVEIRKNRINQIEINEEAGQGFSDGIRAILRQAPDIIFVGEIRDLETAMRVLELAITGHLVLCTVHASSIEMIPSRLKEVGLERTEPFENSVCLAIHQELRKKNKDDNELSLLYEISDSEVEPIKKTRKVNYEY